jgi:hypothetical protein
VYPHSFNSRIIETGFLIYLRIFDKCCIDFSVILGFFLAQRSIFNLTTLRFFKREIKFEISFIETSVIKVLEWPHYAKFNSKVFKKLKGNKFWHKFLIETSDIF